MVKTLSAAASAAILITGAACSPSDRHANGAGIYTPIGYDPSFVRVLSDDDVVPEIIYLEDNFNDTLAALESVEPFIPEVGEVDDNSEFEKRFINGADDRYVYSDTNYPWGATGKLYWSNGVFCSGALIGPRHVLTAKHCLTEGASGTFAPGFDNGPRLGSGAVTLAVTTGIEWGTPCGWKGDWAILIIDNRLGDQRGYFGAKMPDKNLQDRAIFNHVGYPGDRDGGNRPYRTNGNTVQSFRAWDCDGTGPFYTDTDTAGGQSGGAHWENTDSGAYAWGTLSVTFAGGSTAWAGWGSGSQMIQTIGDLRSQYP